MVDLIEPDTVKSFFYHYPSTRSAIGAIQTAITGRPISSDERTVLKGVEGLDDDCILMGFFERMGIPIHQVESAMITYKAALNGKVYQQEVIGMIFNKFEHFESARLWWTRAAAAGSKMGRFQMGVLYLTGKGGPTDPDRAEDIFKSFIKDSDAEFRSKSYHNLGMIFAARKNLEEMERCFLEAVKLDNVSAIKNMGDIYYSKGEVEKAKQMYQRAHDLGDGCGTFRLACFADNNIQAMALVTEAAQKGSWRANIYLAHRVLMGQSMIRDFRYAQDLLRQAYPKIPASHGAKIKTFGMIWYLETFGDGVDPTDGPEYLSPDQIDRIMQGDFLTLPKERTIEEDACWDRDNLNFYSSRALFTASVNAEGHSSPRVHFNLGMMHFHGLGIQDGKMNPARALFHLKRYIDLSEPSYMHSAVLAIMDELVKILAENPEAIPVLKELGFMS